MGGALLKGWLSRGFSSVAVVEPKPSAALRKLCRQKRVRLVAALQGLPKTKISACVVALKPQVLRTEAAQLGAIAKSGALMISIAAGTSVSAMRQAWGEKVRVVRAMPNTPGAIGKGISALYAANGVTAKDRALAQSLLSALGETIWVKNESLIDVTTAVSGSGPAYVFLLVEALAAAAEAEGMPPKDAAKLARATISGAGALLDADPRAASELRKDVTSPGGTTEAALRILTAQDGFSELMARAVKAAYERAKELSG
ncbi:MAG: pyrroline-5-carboxylate reductase [Proteobacteria bacterium]|nr:pyrroline-5-carboxylate reductase [Pseudomonadota bacterium]